MADINPDLAAMSTEQLLALRQQAVSNIAINQNESAGAPDTATGIVNPASGARGNMQVLPTTAQNPGFGVQPSNGTPQDDARVGRDYHAALTQKYGDPETAAIAYDMGPAKTDNWIANGRDLSTLPTETLKYLKNFKTTVQANQPVMNNQMPGTGPAPVAMGAPDATPPAAPLTPNQKAIQAALADGPLDQLTHGIASGAANVVGGGAQLLAHGIGSGLNAAGYPNAAQTANNAGDAVANFIHQGTPETIPGQIGQGIGMAAIPMPAKGIPSAIAGGAVMGAAQPVLNDADYWKAKALQTTLGAAAGGAGAAVGRVVGGAPVSADVKRMMDLGITPLPGQAMGGAFARTEEKATSVPLLGDMIKNGQRSNIEQFNRAMYQNALAPIGGQLPKDVATGAAGIGEVANQIGQQYQTLESQAQFAPKGAFIRDLNQIRAQLSQDAPSALQQFDNVVQNQVTNKLQNGVMSGPNWGDTRSTVSGMARNNRMGNTTPDNRALAGALDDLNGAINDQVARNSPASVRPALQNANQAWSRYKQLENAAGSSGAMNNQNVFTPAQFMSAVRRGSTNSQRAQGTGLNQDIASAAQNVLGNKYPDSGTAGRSLLGLGAMALGHGAIPGAGYAIPPILGASALYGTNMGRAAMLAAIARRPEVLRQLGGAAVGAGPAIGGAAAGMLSADRNRDGI